MERGHFTAQHGSKFAQRFLVPRIVFQTDFGLHFSVVNNDGAEFFFGVAGVKSGARFFDVGEQFHPFAVVFAELVVEGVWLQIP